MITPGHFHRPLSIGAPDPICELPLSLERTIHFQPPHIEKRQAKAGQIAQLVAGKDPERAAAYGV